MSIQGIALIDLIGLGLIVLILNLVRTKKLHVAYAVIWFLAVVGLIVVITVPPFLALLPKVVGATFPASALSLVAFIFIFLILIFFSVQLSTISARQVELAQALALNELLAQDGEAEPHSSNRMEAS
ncbi:MAG: DUF2304 domain-containing protein [Anaerolineae bacterium]|nr:DUF2304 domain-containing protein [Anaerolineae bacterium]